MKDAVLRVLGQEELCIYGTQYCIDFQDSSELLERRTKKDYVQVRLLIDKSQHLSSSCWTQKKKVEDLASWGVQVKMIRPPAERGRYALMHVKSWCIDGTAYLDGPASFTRNSLVCSYEHLVVLIAARDLRVYLNWFEDLWRIAEDLS